MTGDIARRFRLLPPAARARWATLAPLGLAAAALEGLGGALVFALMSVLLAPDGANPGRLVGFLRAWLPSGDSATTLVVLALLAAALHITRNLVVVAAAWWRARVAAFDTAALSTRLLDAYMRAPWPFHLKRSSAALMENVRDSTRPFFDVFESAATVLTESAVVVALMTVAGLVAPLAITIFAACVTLIVAATWRFTRAAQHRGGTRQFELGTALYRHVQQSVGALKEVRILGRGSFFVEAFRRDAEASARLQTTRAALDVLPRTVLETAFVLGMLALVAVSAFRGNASSVLPLVSLYAYTGFRVVPACHRIAVQMNGLRWSLAATEPLVADIRDLERAPAPEDRSSERMPFRECLRAEGVTFAYEERRRSPSRLPTDGHGSDVLVLRDVSLSIRAGESVAIVGATGAGKSTLVDVLIGLLPPASGRVTVDGIEIAGALRAWQRNIGYVPQTPFLVDDTLRRNVAFGLPDDEVDEQALSRAVAAARLESFVAGLPQGIHTVVGERGIRLSGGERQRVAIARALYTEPALVVFDEATSSLDPRTERDVAQAIDQLHGTRTIVVIAHRLTTVERCDRVLLLKGGRLEASGSYAELTAGNPAFRSLAAL